MNPETVLATVSRPATNGPVRLRIRSLRGNQVRIARMRLHDIVDQIAPRRIAVGLAGVVLGDHAPTEFRDAAPWRACSAGPSA